MGYSRKILNAANFQNRYSVFSKSMIQYFETPRKDQEGDSLPQGDFMKCRYCQCTDSRVVDSRPTEDGTAIRRRRECTNCGRRFTTYEKVEEMPVIVVKRDGTRENFDSSKILRGVRKSCEKRPVSAAAMDALVEDVEREINNSLEQEVTTIKIGELVMNRLKDLDEVAYVRFASVYRSFKDINTFMEELKLLLGDKDAK